MYCLLPLVVSCQTCFCSTHPSLEGWFYQHLRLRKVKLAEENEMMQDCQMFFAQVISPTQLFQGETSSPSFHIDMLWDQLGSIYNSGWGFEQNHQVLTLSGGGDNSTLCRDAVLHIFVVVSQIFNFHPLLGEIIQFDSYFSNGLKSPTRYPFCATDSSFISCLWWCNDYMFLDSCCKTQCLSCVLLRRSSKK